MRDIDYDPATATDYECIQCGTIVTAEDNPVSCPECEAPVRNREMPME